MKIILHRRNTIAQLQETPPAFGVEVDIRSQGDALRIHHDPFADGESFDDWIAHYHHQTLILNVKEEGLEGRLLALMTEHQISDFFFLDQSFPFLVKTSRTGESRCAVRVSEYESIDTALTLSRQVDWIWVDCFTRFPLDVESADRLVEAGFKLCIVSPELQGRDVSEISEMRNLLDKFEILPDAVCTKVPALWS
jgi:hypothetical protein